GSEESLNAVRWAAHEAASRNLPLRTVYAFDELYATEWRWQTEYVVATLREGAEDIINEANAVALAEEPQLPTSGEVIIGRHTSVLTKESERAALMVMGSRRLGPFRSMLGSVSSSISARAVCPVVVVRGTGDEPTHDQPVVVGVDVAEHGDRVDPEEYAHHTDHILEFAFDHAARHGLPLRAVTCWRPFPVARGGRSDYGMGVRAEGLSDRLRRLVGRWPERYPNVSVEERVREGRPVDVLVDEASNAGLLVVGARGHRPITGMLLGSVSQGVLHHAHCAVAVVHRGPSEV
ncbi:MAG TPA: universal stress protein, partial [Actinopolymorphaceae bacterium]